MFKSPNTLYRFIAFGAGTGSVLIWSLGLGFSSHRLIGLLPLGILGGYAATHLNRVGILWGVFGALSHGLLFFVLSVLPRGDLIREKVPLSNRIPPWLVTPLAVAFSLFAVWFSTSDFALWSDAQDKSSVKSYESYLAQRPNGAHIDEAKANLARLRPKRDRLETWLKRVRESRNHDDVFTVSSKSAGTFKPNYFPVYLDSSELDLIGSRIDLVDSVEKAHTILLIQISSYEIFKYTDGRSGYHTDLTICLVDSENTQRRRVMKAWVDSPPRFGRIIEHRDYGIDGVNYKDGPPVSGLNELLSALLKKAAK